MSAKEEMLSKVKVSVIVPAAGTGDRMQGEIPKQYLKVCGSPLVTHCIRALSKPSWITKVVVVADDCARMAKELEKDCLPKITIIEGKGSRHRSIMSGLEYLAMDLPDIVVIHDGVRPLVPEAILTEVVVKSIERGAAGVVRPLVSTVVVPDEENLLQESLERSKYKNSEMPQAFNFQMLLNAYRRCPIEELEIGTECLAIAHNFGGVRAYLVQGTPELWKVTFPQDIEMARLVLPRRIQKFGILYKKCSEFSTLPGQKNSNCEYLNLTEDVDASNPSSFPLQALGSEMKVHYLDFSEEECFMSKKNCLVTRNTITTILPVITKNCYETFISNSHSIYQVHLSVLIIITCIRDISDVENIFVQQKSLGRIENIDTIIIILNTISLEEMCIKMDTIRRIANTSFRKDLCLVIIFRSTSQSNQSTCDADDRLSQFQQIMEVCCSKFCRNLNRQVFFVS